MFFVGDADEGGSRPEPDEFDHPPVEVVRDMVGGGVSLPWNLALPASIGLWLLFTRLVFGSTGAMADADHVIGFLVLTVVSVASSEVARPARYVNMLLGLALLTTPFLYDAGSAATVNSIACGVALIGLARRPGPISQRWRTWTRCVV